MLRWSVRWMVMGWILSWLFWFVMVSCSWSRCSFLVVVCDGLFGWWNW